MTSTMKCYYKDFLTVSLGFAFISLLVAASFFHDRGAAAVLIMFLHLSAPPILFFFLVLREMDRLGFSCEEIEKAASGLVAYGQGAEFVVGFYYLLFNSPTLVVHLLLKIELHPLLTLSASLGLALLLYLVIRRHDEQQLGVKKTSP